MYVSEMNNNGERDQIFDRAICCRVNALDRVTRREDAS